jgi:hypothetical protein
MLFTAMAFVGSFVLSIVDIITLITFVALKLTGCILWAWIWVLTPLWIGIPVITLWFLYWDYVKPRD